MAKKITWEKRTESTKKEGTKVPDGKAMKKAPRLKGKVDKKDLSESVSSSTEQSAPRVQRTESRSSRGSAKSSPDRGTGSRKRSSDNRTEKPRSRNSDTRKRTPQSEEDESGKFPRNRKFSDKGKVERDFRSRDKKGSFSKFSKDKPFKDKPFKDKPFKGKPAQKTEDDGTTRLNKYIARAGICSRREADTHIANGLITINGEVVTELGTKVKPGDVVTYAGEKVNTEIMRYVLLNKPKDCITTTSDERGRLTVMSLVRNACKERIYPVGRLDRNTTGLLLLTNDGDMAKKLTHPSHEIRKVYHVILNKNVTQADLQKLEAGVELEDGVAKADAALYVGDGSVKNEIGLEIHSGKNRVVRRMFAALGYEVTRLDRASFAGLSKKALPRGRWRHLTEKELSYLRML